MASARRYSSHVANGRPTPRPSCCGRGAQEVLRAVEAYDQIAKQALPLHVARYHSCRRKIADVDLRHVEHLGFGGPLAIPQPLVEEALELRYLELGGTLRRGVRVTRLLASARQVELSSESGWVCLSDYVIGADGVRSTIRQLSGIEYRRTEYPDDFFLADGKLLRPGDRGRADYFMARRSSCVRVPLPDERDRAFITFPRRHEAQREDPATPGAVNELLARHGHGDFRFARVGTATFFRVYKGLADSFLDLSGRVALAGDAAHVHSPAGGQGMNTGIQDAHALCWRMAQAIRSGADPSVLASYSAERQRVARQVIRATNAQIRSWSLPLLPATLVRDTVLRAAARRPERLLRAVAQVDPLGPGRSTRRARSLGEILAKPDWAVFQRAAQNDLASGAMATYVVGADASGEVERILARNGVRRLVLRPDYVVHSYEQHGEKK